MELVQAGDNTPPRLAYVGTAGWSVPRKYSADFPETGSHLERYAQRFSAVEINSSFYKPHRNATYGRWAASVPDDFRFAVKVPRRITHELKLVETGAVIEGFLADVSGLGAKLGPLLVQLPPSLAFDPQVARSFFSDLRARVTGAVVCEPRHPSWFDSEAEGLLIDFQMARAAADPAPVPEAATPGGWPGLAYYRLHGSPRIYYSAYPDDRLEALARDLRERRRSSMVWCIFDNTALEAATGDALSTQRRMIESL